MTAFGFLFLVSGICWKFYEVHGIFFVLFIGPINPFHHVKLMVNNGTQLESLFKEDYIRSGACEP